MSHRHLAAAVLALLLTTTGCTSVPPPADRTAPAPSPPSRASVSAPPADSAPASASQPAAREALVKITRTVPRTRTAPSTSAGTGTGASADTAPGPGPGPGTPDRTHGTRRLTPVPTPAPKRHSAVQHSARPPAPPRRPRTLTPHKPARSYGMRDVCRAAARSGIDPAYAAMCRDAYGR